MNRIEEIKEAAAGLYEPGTSEFQAACEGAAWADKFPLELQYIEALKVMAQQGVTLEAKLKIAIEALEQAKFDLVMIKENGGFNERQPDLIVEALKNIESIK